MGGAIWLYKRPFCHRNCQRNFLRLKRLHPARQVRSTRSVSQGTEVTIVTEYVPCRYSTSYCVMSKDAMGTQFNHAVLIEERLNLYLLKHSMLEGSIMTPRQSGLNPKGHARPG